MKKAFNLLFFLLSCILLSYLLIMSTQNRAKIKCDEISINVDVTHDLHFIDAEIVTDLLLQIEDSLIGMPYEDINIYLLEEFITEHPNIEKAELYLSNNGTLSILVEQRKPIARVYASNQSYYLDSKIKSIPLSDKYSARVPLIYCSEMTLKIKGMIRTIFAILEQDPFLKAQITAVEFDENDEIMMYPRIGNHKIIVGNVNRLAEKLKNLKMFYQKGLNKVGWGSYSSINLKFDNQVVCTKR
tara:strand:- start:490 stop:1218 length:729 start_codon:yes stop_codon:yes gene_type:complete